VTASGPEGLRLDRTVFYPMGGGQPGDCGSLTLPDGSRLRVVDAVKGESHEDVVHVLEEGATPPAPGTQVTAEIDWDRRHRHMRMHTCLHLLCAVVTGDVTGGQIGADKGRLDFNLPDTQLDKEAITAELNRLVAEDHPVQPRWISDDELAAQPELVRTMSVKPPSGGGRVRLLDIAGVDLQPCGGTHVRQTGEIGRVRVGKIENKGRQNRRINILFDE
jgi:misacylated tRNA(Ala) deacylase